MESPPRPCRTVGIGGNVLEDHVINKNPSSFVITLPIVTQKDNDDDATSASTIKSPEGAGVERMIDRVLSLPQVVSEVAVQHKDQVHQLSVAQALLEQNKAKLEEEQEKILQVRAELCALKKRLYLLNEETSNLTSLNASLAKAVNTLNSEVCGLVWKREQLTEENEKAKSLFEEQCEKMKKHEAAVAEMEQDTDSHSELINQRHKLLQLKQQKVDLVEKYTGATAEKLSDLELKLERSKKERSEVEGKRVKQDKELQQIQEKKKKVEQEIDVLHKRNNAQMTRLKRQLKEIQLRNRQWSNKRAQLERAVSETRRSLGVTDVDTHV